MKTQYMALIKDTINKELRSKTLIAIFIVTTLAILLSHTMTSLLSSQMGQDSSLAIVGVNLLSLSFSILNWLIFIIAIVFGISTIRSDFENNIIYQYLSFPISRMEYFFIRVIGTWILVFGYYFYAYILTTILYSISFKTNIYTIGHFGSFVVMALYILLVIFIAILFSMMMNKLAAFISLILLTVTSGWAYNTFSVIPTNEWLQGFNVFKGLGLALYFLFPRFKFLDGLSASLLSGNMDKWQPMNLSWEIIHLVVISGAIVYFGSLLVKKRDF